MSRRRPALKNNNQLTMVGRLDAVCTRGVGKEVMGEGEDNGGEEERDEAHPIYETGGETRRRQRK
jgi:hypothetical protein